MSGKFSNKILNKFIEESINDEKVIWNFFMSHFCWIMPPKYSQKKKYEISCKNKKGRWEFDIYKKRLNI